LGRKPILSVCGNRQFSRPGKFLTAFLDHFAKLPLRGRRRAVSARTSSPLGEGKSLMSSTIQVGQRATMIFRPARRSVDKLIHERVQLALVSAQPHRLQNERRRETRYPYPYPIYLTPVDRDGKPTVGPAIGVVGKHLSEHGLDFYHREPLPYRRVIASLACGSGQWVGLLMDLSWCRFCRHGWYDSGGRFLQAVASPVEIDDEFSQQPEA
jgi:hypothetical protein